MALYVKILNRTALFVNLDFKQLHMKNYFILLSFLIPFGFTAQNQATNSGGQSKQIQPTIIAIPKAKKGQDIRSILENSFNLRLALSVVKKSFDERGYTTYDFEATLRKCETMDLFTNKNQSNFQDIIAKNSSADIFVVVDCNIDDDSNGKKATVILEAYETYTGRSLANDQGSSTRLRTSDYNKLITNAITSKIVPFLNLLQTKFTQIVEDGRSVQIIFGLDENAAVTYDDEIGNEGDLISELIMDWMDENSYKNYAKIANQTERIILYEDVRIPLKDQQTGMNYDPRKFGRTLRKYLRGLGLTVSVQYPRGQISVTLK
jgi:hypothetical protein